MSVSPFEPAMNSRRPHLQPGAMGWIGDRRERCQAFVGSRRASSASPSPCPVDLVGKRASNKPIGGDLGKDVAKMKRIKEARLAGCRSSRAALLFALRRGQCRLWIRWIPSNEASHTRGIAFEERVVDLFGDDHPLRRDADLSSVPMSAEHGPLHGFVKGGVG